MFASIQQSPHPAFLYLLNFMEMKMLNLNFCQLLPAILILKIILTQNYQNKLTPIARVVALFSSIMREIVNYIFIGHQGAIFVS